MYAVVQAAAREHRAQVWGQAAHRLCLDAPQRLHPLVRRVLLLCVPGSLSSRSYSSSWPVLRALADSAW